MVVQNNSWLTTVPIAHRGLHNKEYPENSIGAFVNARRHGYAIELDVQLSLDEQIVVFHDSSTYRMTQEKGTVSKLSLAELQHRKLLATSFRIPTLREVLQIVGKDTPLLIEIKNSGKAGKLEELLCQELDGFAGYCAVQSFNACSIQYVKNHCPQITRGILSQNYKNKKMNFVKKFVLKNFLFNCFCEPNFIAYDIKDLPQKKICAFREQGMPIIGWTIRTEQDLIKARKYCDNIIFESISPEA